MEMDQIIRDLEAAAREEGTETGECWRGLCDAWRIVHYGCSEELCNALEQEIRDQYKFLTQNFTWVDYEEIKCDSCGRGRPAYRELVWNEELYDHL